MINSWGKLALAFLQQYFVVAPETLHLMQIFMIFAYSFHMKTVYDVHYGEYHKILKV